VHDPLASHDTLAGASLLLSLGMTREGRPVAAALACVHADAAPDLWALRHRFLHPGELARAEGFPAQARRTSFLLGRYAAKRAAHAAGADVPMPALEIVSGVFGQPILRGAGDAPAVSISHTGALAAAVACAPEHIVAVDVEVLAPRLTEVFESMLTPAELARARQIAGVELGPNLLWSMKEALSKALRCGLTTRFEVLETEEFAVTGPGRYRCLFVNFAQYRCETLVIGDHVLSLAFPKNSQIDLSAEAVARLERVVTASA
jgi:4'-phosphopantetheinyl transferase